MHRVISFLTVAMMAISALAAPTPAQQLKKRSFTVPVKTRRHGFLSPAQEMARTYLKYGWEIITINPQDPFAGLFGSESSSAAAPAFPSATFPAFSAPASSAAPTISAAPYPSASSNATTGPGSMGSAPAASPTSGSLTTSTDAVPSSSGDGVTAEVTATPEDNESEYLENVSVGGQPLVLDFDTGSADLWVFSSSLSSSESAGHSVFNPDKSSTFSEYQGGSWKIQYGDQSSASGTVGFDKVTISGATVTKQAVELATAVSGSFVQDENNDGLVGLAFSTINTVQPQPQKTWFENIMGSLAQPLFTANLREDNSGSYTFGTIDESEYTGDIHYTPIDKSNGFWQFDSSSYAVGGTTKQCETCSPAIADTGTSLLLVDDDVAAAYYAQISSAEMNYQQGGYVYDCNAQLPSFGVAIGSGYTATLTGSEITFAEVGDGTCFGGIQGNSGGGIQIFGDVLLKHFLAVFDGGNERFGLAEQE